MYCSSFLLPLAGARGIGNVMMTCILPTPFTLVRSVYVEEATPSYGQETLEAFFTKAVKEGLK